MRASVNMMKERAPELEKNQAVAVSAQETKKTDRITLNLGKTYPPST